MNIRLIIPQQNKAKVYVNVARYLPRIANIAGGFTSWEGQGGWKDSQGQLIVEPITIVEASLNDSAELNSFNVGTFRLLAQCIARDLGQDCVYLSVDGVVEYVSEGNVAPRAPQDNLSDIRDD